jgi:GntR family transcriptional regulator/MocR family aminotransferase
MPARGDTQRHAGRRHAAVRIAHAGGRAGLARNTVLYAYEQLASEGFVITDRRGTVVAAVAPDRNRRRGRTPARLRPACRSAPVRCVPCPATPT